VYHIGARNDLVAQAYTPIILSPSSVTDTLLSTVSTISMTAVGKSAPDNGAEIAARR